MPDYGSYCPISLGTEVVADRWTPLVLRELFMGATRFNDIARGLPAMSRSLLVQRLRHLERKGVVELWPSASGRGNEYRLTAAGKDLEPVVLALGRWAVTWLYDELRADDIDAVTLMWWMHRHVDLETVPEGRVVVQFDHTAPERVTIWMVLDRGQVSVCMHHPGFEPDAIVSMTTPALAEVFAGNRTWRSARSDGTLHVEGPSRILDALPRWFRQSPFADDVRAQSAHRLAAQG